MIKKVKLAKINLTMQTGTIVRWLKKEALTRAGKSWWVAQITLTSTGIS